MKVYIIAFVEGRYMLPIDNKVYKTKKAALKKCEQLNVGKIVPYVVLCADNWHLEDEE